MTNDQITDLRYHWANYMVGDNYRGSKLQEAATVIIGLLDQIHFYQDELDRVRAATTAEDSSAD